MTIANENFDWDNIKDGVPKGQRHATLTSYCNWLQNCRHYSKSGIVTILTRWNRLNTPPMHPEEVVGNIYDLWVDRPKPPTEILTLENRPTEKSTSSLDGAAKPDKEAAPETKYVTDLPSDEVNLIWSTGSWFLEPGMPGCTCYRAAIRKGQQYESVPSPCNEWMCDMCFKRMRKEWIEYLVEVTRGQQLYVMIVKHNDWPTVLWAINKAGADYVRIRKWRYDKSKVILNKSLVAATHVSCNKLSADILESRLEAFMPDYPPRLRDYVEPVCSSPGWDIFRRPKDPMVKTVIRTWLPVYRQKEVAFKLGAEITGHFEWQSPEDVSEDEWERAFIAGVQNQEKTIDEILNKLDDRDRARTRMGLYILDGYPELFEGRYGEI